MAAGRYTLKLRLTHKGIYRLRVLTVASPGHPTLTSATRTVKAT
jgi:hypothetical protein